MLKLRLLRWPPCRWFHPLATLGMQHLPGDERVDAVAALPTATRARIRLFERHAGYGIHERLNLPADGAAYFVMLREPVDRGLSVYHHLSRGGGLDGVSLADFVHWRGHTRGPDRPFLWSIDNAQVRYLAGDRGELVDVPVGDVTDEHLDLAKRRIDGAIRSVLLLERFDESVLLLSRHLGISPMRYMRSNVNTARPREGVDPDTLASLREHNQLDAQLHAHAAARFEVDLDEVAPDLSEQLARYRRRNARFATLARPVYAAFPLLRRRLGE